MQTFYKFDCRQPACYCRKAEGRDFVLPTKNLLITEINKRHIDCITVDPYISCHKIPENDNTGMDIVTKTWAEIAQETKIGAELVHHVRKPGNGSLAEFTEFDARGATAIIAAARSSRILNRMSKEDAERCQVEEKERKLHFSITRGKDYLRAPAESAEWYKLISVPLNNATPEDPGDWIGVVTRWEPPNVLDGVEVADLRRVQKRISEGQWRADIRAKEWAGIAIAEVLRIDPNEPKAKAKCKQLLTIWIQNRVLKVVFHDDEKRREKEYIEVGELA